MMQRCVWNSADEKKKKYYKNRNITVCEKWHSYMGFKEDMYLQFIEHCKKYGIENTSIDRIDNDAGYSPVNCKWSTREEQANNRRYVPKVSVNINGETHCVSIAELSRLIGLNYQTLKSRYRCGMRGDELTQPLIKNNGTGPKKAVRRINDGKEFESAKSGAEDCGLLSYHNILSCCRGQLTYSGIHPITGEKCRWEFAS